MPQHPIGLQFPMRNTKWLKNGKLRKAILSAFHNISQRNFGILLILWCSFKLWWNICLDQNLVYNANGPLNQHNAIGWLGEKTMNDEPTISCINQDRNIDNEDNEVCIESLTFLFYCSIDYDSTVRSFDSLGPWVKLFRSYFETMTRKQKRLTKSQSYSSKAGLLRLWGQNEHTQLLWHIQYVCSELNVPKYSCLKLFHT